MNCKFCNMELPEGVTLCPDCGRENLEETLEETAVEAVEAEETTEVTEAAAEIPVKAKPKIWLIVLAVIGALAIAAVLGAAVYFGIDAANSAPSYTVSAEKAEKERDTVVATVGDIQLTNSQLQIHYWTAANEFYSYYGSYMGAEMLDFSKPLDEQFYNEEEGITWQSFFLENALSSWSRYAALSMQGKDAGFQLIPEAQEYLDTIPDQLEQMALDNNYASAQDMLEKDMGAACDTDGYLAYINNSFYAGQYLDSQHEVLLPTQEEIEAYYQENEGTLASQGVTKDTVHVDVRHILLTPQTDEEGNSSENEWELCHVEAQKLLDQWKAGEATEDSFSQLATEHSQDPGSAAAGGLYTDVYEGQMVEPFEDWCFDAGRAYGDTGLVKTDYGYHIMYFVSSREIWTDTVKDAIVNERSLAMVDEAVAKYPMDVNYKKIVLSDDITETAE